MNTCKREYCRGNVAVATCQGCEFDSQLKCELSA